MSTEKIDSTFEEEVEDEVDSELYKQYLATARELASSTSNNLDWVRSSGCISTGLDQDGNTCIFFAPQLGIPRAYLPGETEPDIIRKMMLLFILEVDNLVRGPFTLVYGHYNLSWLAQRQLLYDSYQMLPRRYKKNLRNMFIVHPNMKLRMFFEFCRLFVSRKFFDKLHLVSDIASLQGIIPHTSLKLPPGFIRFEDEDLGYKFADELPALSDTFNSALGATKTMHSCAAYIRSYGLQVEGIFRVPGDHTLVTLAFTRVMNTATERYVVVEREAAVSAAVYSSSSSSAVPSSSSHSSVSEVDLSTYMKEAEPSEDSASESPSLSSSLSSSAPISVVKDDIKVQSHSQRGKMSCVHIDDIHSVGTLFKGLFRFLPVPLFPFEAYARIMEIAARFEGDFSAAVAFRTELRTVIESMPREHSETLRFLIKLLSEVAAEAGTNKMTPENLGIVFGPTVMWPKPENSSTDQLEVLRQMRISSLTVKALILELIEDSESSKILNRLSMSQLQLGNTSGGNRRGGGRFS